jgi:serine/threonine protein kinase
MSDLDELEARLARIVEHHATHGTLPPLQSILGDRPDLAGPLEALVRRYLDLSHDLDTGEAFESPAAAAPDALPAIEGFRTIERIGRGGMGSVYKLQDLALDRVVAAKVLDRGGPEAARLADLLREARAMALFSDPRIVRIFELRADADPPVIIMEHVEGFELGRLGPSLELRQRAAVMQSIAEAVHHAHAVGVQHRDLKPSNIMLDSRLSPKILDFGLSDGNPAAGHLRGTVAYLAPEQLDPAQPIDARTDVHALGVILYELVTGSRPYEGATDADVLAAIRRGRPTLPIDVDPRVPEPLQAIALKAMERDPAERYQSAREMSLDLARWLDGLPVTARPTLYASTLADRVRPHLDAVADWLRLKLIYPHEAARLQAAYRQLDAREDDWIVASRALTPSQIALYLGAFLLLAGSLFYFAAHQIFQTTAGPLGPLVTLGLPFAGLSAAGRWLYQREHRAVGVAFYLAGVGLLPLLLVIWLDEAGLWAAAPEAPNQLFADGAVSNRQLQVSALISCAWAAWLAFRTRTGALSTVSTVLLLVLTLTALGDLGLRAWIETGNYDRFAVHLLPLLASYGAAGALAERRGYGWFARPLYVAAALTLVAALDLLALDGEMFRHMGLSLSRLNPVEVTDPLLVDTVAALTLNGALFYLAAELVERRGGESLAPAGLLLLVISPFSVLEPLAYLTATGEYSLRFDWTYLALAIAIALLSHRRQRRSFYYAGLINTGFALYYIADHNDWFDEPLWAMAVVGAGLAALAAGFLLDRRRSQV